MAPLPNGTFLNVRIAGTLPSDVWSIGFWFAMSGSTGTPTPANMNSAADALLQGFNTVFWGAISNPWKAQCSTGTALTNSKSYWYVNNVLLAGGSSSLSAVVGTGTQPQPSYVSRVVTLQTNTPGRRTRGRVYLPSTGVGPNAGTGVLSSASSALGQLAGLFSSSTGAQSTGYFFGGTWVGDFVVVSRTGGFATSITSMRMDNKPDTQRNRLDKLAATIFDTSPIT